MERALPRHRVVDWLFDRASGFSSPFSRREPTRPPADVATGVPAYRRYSIATHRVKDLRPHPTRFRVRVNGLKLVRMVLHELLFEYRHRPAVALSRPCVYGVFGRIVGGLAPRHELCVGCLRCTTQYPDMVTVLPNPERTTLGDSCHGADLVDTILYEARSGRVPVRGAGYRGRFGGAGWDGMWTDMSEIVRPTRDGIHGRETISTSVDIGVKPSYLVFGEDGEPVEWPQVVSIPVPVLFDVPPRSIANNELLCALDGAAAAVDSIAFLPIDRVIALAIRGPHIAPVVAPDSLEWIDRLRFEPRVLELSEWNAGRYRDLTRRLRGSVIAVRVPMDADLVALHRQGARVVHLVADYHGRIGDRFAMDMILDAHRSLVDAGIREEMTLIGSGGIVAAEHVPKAIIAGLDAVAIDTAIWIALQARFRGECRDRENPRIELFRCPTGWGSRRIQNLVASWRDQLLEILGAMGIREARRLRGELGRCMFQKDLEAEAFAGIEGFDGR